MLCGSLGGCRAKTHTSSPNRASASDPSGAQYIHWRQFTLCSKVPCLTAERRLGLGLNNNTCEMMFTKTHTKREYTRALKVNVEFPMPTHHIYKSHNPREINANRIAQRTTSSSSSVERTAVIIIVYAITIIIGNGVDATEMMANGNENLSIYICICIYTFSIHGVIMIVILGTNELVDWSWSCVSR